MKNGSKVCPFCFSKFTFEAFELVDSLPADQPCEGCVRLYATLAESARRKAIHDAAEQWKADRRAEEPHAEPVDLSTPSSILARLMANRSMPSPAFDARKAQAGDKS